MKRQEIPIIADPFEQWARALEVFREPTDWLKVAQASLAGLEFVCKIFLLRAKILRWRYPSDDGLIEPMEEHARELNDGIRRAQQALVQLEKQRYSD